MEDKKEAGAAHLAWLHQLKTGYLLYTDGSRNKINSLGWAILEKTRGQSKVSAQGHCNIGPYADVLDAEIHIIREGINWIIGNNRVPACLHICVDNQQALRSLTGGKTRVNEDLKACLNGIMKLQQAGCSVKEQWTPFHKCTITWTSIQSRKRLMNQWEKESADPPYPLA